MPEPLTRSQVRDDLRVYMMKTGISLTELAERAGYARQTVLQFVSRGRFGDADETGATAQNLAAFMLANPARLPEFPGTIYETQGTRAMRDLIDDAREGVWGILYAPYGAQKTFLFETMFAEAAREEKSEPNWFALVEAVERMTPNQLLREISRGVGAPYAHGVPQIREGILWTLRRRREPVVVMIDEAQLLYTQVDTLECLRRLGDLARGRMGVIVAGNEKVLELFKPRKHSSMGQWRSRVEQRRLRVLGPTESEARRIARAEVPDIRDSQLDKLIAGARDRDPLRDEEGKEVHYTNLRRMFNTLRDFRRARRKAN